MTKGKGIKGISKDDLVDAIYSMAPDGKYTKTFLRSKSKATLERLIYKFNR